MKEVLLLDVMDTVVRDPYRQIPGFFGMDFAEFWPLLDRGAWPDFERAIIDEATFLGRFFRDGRAFDHAAFLAMIQEGYRFVDGMEELLAELHGAGVVMHALSNYPCWFERIEEKLELSHFLPWTFVSWTTGLRKPDPDAYLFAARSLARPPAACLFVDDRESNCQAARDIGMSALRFEGAAQLRGELVVRGLV